MTTGIFSAIFLVIYHDRRYFLCTKPGFDILYADGVHIAVRPCISSDDRKGAEAMERHHSWYHYGVIWFVTGMHWAFSLGYIGMGIIADLVAGAGDYRNKAVNLLSYMLMSLGGVYTYVVFFIDPQGWASTMLENGTEQSYIDTMSASAPSWLLAVIIIGTLAIAAFSGWIGGKLMKKQFEKAGITA